MYLSVDHFCLPICLPTCLSSVPICLSVRPSIHSPSQMLPRGMIFEEDSFLHLPRVRFQEQLTHRRFGSLSQGRPAHRQEAV